MDVFIVLEAWGEDSPDVVYVYDSQEAADAYIRRATETEDDYTSAHRHFFVQRRQVHTTGE